MWLLVADAPPTAQDSSTAIVLAVIGLLTAVLVAVTAGVFSLLSARQNRAPAAPLAAAGGIDLAFRDHVIGELAVGRQRDDDSDERDEVQDRRLDQIERVLDLDNPNWRHR